MLSTQYPTMITPVVQSNVNQMLILNIKDLYIHKPLACHRSEIAERQRLISSSSSN